MEAAYNRFGCHSCRLCGWLSGSSSGVLAQRNPQVKLVLILLQTGRCRFSHSCPASQMLPVDHQATWHVWFVVLFLRHGCCKKATVSLQSGTLSELHLPASWLIEVPFLFFVVKFHKLCSYMKHLMNVGYFHDLHFSHL